MLAPDLQFCHSGLLLKPFCLGVLRTPLLLVAQIDATMIQTLAKLTFDGRETSVQGSRSYPEVVCSCAPEDHFVVQTSLTSFQLLLLLILLYPSSSHNKDLKNRGGRRQRKRR